jgi:hypothetical protein
MAADQFQAGRRRRRSPRRDDPLLERFNPVLEVGGLEAGAQLTQGRDQRARLVALDLARPGLPVDPRELLRDGADAESSLVFDIVVVPDTGRCSSCRCSAPIKSSAR